MIEWRGAASAGLVSSARFSGVQSYLHSNAGLQDRRLDDFLFQTAPADSRQSHRKTLPA